MIAQEVRLWHESRAQLDMEGPEVKRVLKEAPDETVFWEWKGVTVPMNLDDEDEAHWGWPGAALDKEQEDEAEMKNWGWPGELLARARDAVPYFTCQAVLTIGIVFQARSRLCNDRGSGEDGVVTELLKAIPPLLVYNIWWWFWACLEGWTHCPASWKRILVAEENCPPEYVFPHERCLFVVKKDDQSIFLVFFVC